MFEQIVPLHPQSGWICDNVTCTAVAVTLIAFRERHGEIEYLAQSWREDGEMRSRWTFDVLSEYVATARASAQLSGDIARARANWGRSSRTTPTTSARAAA